jgi:dihydroflavonol-4-reductase
MILVTGASGFLGQHLVRHLSATGQTVRALYNRHAPDEALLALPGITWQQYDLLDVFAVEEMMRGITDIYHCAAVVTFNPRRREEMLHFNTESTANIVNQALEQGIRKLVYISSVAALGRTADSKKEITEEEEWEESRKNSAYGNSKYLAEMEVWRGVGEGLNAVIVSPGIILGEGDWDEGSARLMKVVYKQFPFYTQGVNAWVDVKDVVGIAHMLMQSDVEAERFILSTGNYGYREIFTLMAESLGKRPPHIKATPFMTGLIWRWNALRMSLFGAKSAITKETAANAQNRCYYNNSKLTRFFPSYQYTPMPDTIKRMATAFLADTAKKA